MLLNIIEHLTENDIRPSLFKGPSIDFSNEKYTIFEWESVILKENPLRIRISVPPFVFQHTRVGGAGDWMDNYYYFVGTDSMSINQAILSHLVRNNFRSGESLRNYLDKFDEASFTSVEQKDLIKFNRINEAIITYLIYHNEYPETIKELICPEKLIKGSALDAINIVDNWGQQYVYQLYGEYVLLGTKGESGVWKIDDAMKAFIFADRTEFVYRVVDNFIVKFIP